MAKKNRNKRALWDQKSLEKALKAVESGKSQREAAVLYRIPRRTLRNHLKSGSCERKMGRNSVLSKDEEVELVK